MRTPKHKKVMQKARNTATNKLRKKAMRNKMVKKTLLEVGGDDTREDVRDLMNDSDMSFNGVVSFVLNFKYFRKEGEFLFSTICNPLI